MKNNSKQESDKANTKFIIDSIKEGKDDLERRMASQDQRAKEFLASLGNGKTIYQIESQEEEEDEEEEPDPEQEKVDKEQENEKFWKDVELDGDDTPLGGEDNEGEDDP